MKSRSRPPRRVPPVELLPTAQSLVLLARLIPSSAYTPSARNVRCDAKAGRAVRQEPSTAGRMAAMEVDGVDGVERARQVLKEVQNTLADDNEQLTIF